MKRIVILVFVILGICVNAQALYERKCAECDDYKYGQTYTSPIGRPGKVIRCGSAFPNDIYGYGIEVRWDDDPSGKTELISINSK